MTICQVLFEVNAKLVPNSMQILQNAHCTKRSNPKGWKARKQNKLQSKDAMGTGRMLSGWAHEYLGFIELTPAELEKCNEDRAARDLPPMKHTNFCLKKFDYDKNREVCCIVCSHNVPAHISHIMYLHNDCQITTHTLYACRDTG